VVLEKNLFEVPARRLGKTRVLMTLIDGEPVYQEPPPND
jgi:predicted amidohydrolase YtcJ